MSYGLGYWHYGVQDPGLTDTSIATAHGLGTLALMPVNPQDWRPKSINYTEADNSENFRDGWGNAIQNGADWVQIDTWSDYSEHTQISPSLSINGEMQRGFYDLGAYYLNWFKSGTQPQITQDEIFYFHRRHSTTLQPTTTANQTGTFTNTHNYGAYVDSNNVEVLAFLVSPGTLQVTVGGVTTSFSASAGFNKFYVPLATGAAPSFKLLRNGVTVISFASQTPVLSAIQISDYNYLSGSATAAGTCYSF